MWLKRVMEHTAMIRNTFNDREICLSNTELKSDKTTPDRAWTFQRGLLYELKGGVLDAEDRGDQNALGLSFIQRVEEKILQ